MIRIVETDGEIVELVATTENGEIRVITAMSKEGDALVLRGLHIDGPGAGAVGRLGLRALATELAKQQGASRVIVHGGRRTTGANPGHIPRPITFLIGD